MDDAPEDAPIELQLFCLAGDLIGCCSLPLSSFGRLVRDVIAELLQLDAEMLTLVGTKGKVDEGDMLCEVTEPGKRFLIVLITTAETS